MADTTAVESSEAFQRMIDDQDPTNWILMNQEANNQIVVCAYGQGGYDEMIQHLDEGKSQFGYFRVIAIDSSSELTSKRAKFVFFSYVGPKVSLMFRAKVSILMSGVRRLFPRTHIEFQISNIEEMTKDHICNDLTRCAGAHAPDSYVFDNQDINISLMDASTSEEVHVESANDFATSWTEFKSDNGINWMLMSIDKSDSISIMDQGFNGLNELKEKLPQDQVAYGIFKVKAFNNVGSIESVRERYIVVCWVPSGAPVFARVKVSNQKNVLLKTLEAYHAEMRADCLDDLSEENVIDLLNRSTGSHKPEKYEF